jgi:dTDP-4-dehydrorhamnose reductase
MVRLAATRPHVDVVTDQTGQPTWSCDVAGRIAALVRAEAAPGTYHATSRGQVSWHGFAREIFRLIGADPERVRPTTAAAFGRPAPRPAWSVLGHEAWKAAGLDPIRPWPEALAEALVATDLGVARGPTAGQ